MWLSIGIFGYAGCYTHLQHLQVESVHLVSRERLFPSAREGIKKQRFHGRHCVLCCSLFTVRHKDCSISVEVFCFAFSIVFIVFLGDRLVSYSIPVKHTEFKVLGSLWEISHLWPHSHQGWGECSFFLTWLMTANSLECFFCSTNADTSEEAHRGKWSLTKESETYIYLGYPLCNCLCNLV